MRHNFLYSIGALLVFAILITACKKERGPRLIIHVNEADGTAASGASVHAWHANAGQNGSVLNDAEMDQTLSTDAAGDATFDFKYSAVLDVDVIYYKNGFDTAAIPNPIIDTLIGHKVVKIEAVRQKSHSNSYNETVVVK